MSPPFRAEHIGSLLRPRTLHAAFRQLSAGEIDAAGYKAVVDAAISDAVRIQEDAGLRVVTDGEFRRISYWSHFVEGIDGFAVRPSAYKFHDADGGIHDFVAPYVERPVKRRDSVSGPPFDYLKSVARQMPKVTMPSPPTLHFWRGRETFGPGTYSDEEAYFADLVAIYRAEIADLAARGCRYIQLDEVPLAVLCDTGVRDTLAAAGTDPTSLSRRYVRLINDCIAEAPSGMTIGLHLCRGNFKGRWLSEGGYDSVAEILFLETRVNAFFLEYDNERSGGFEPLRFLPRDKTAVLGLITTKTAPLEDRGMLARRIEAAARFAPLDNLAVSPQCGFSSTIGGNPVTPEDQRRKLELVVGVARDLWGTA